MNLRLLLLVWLMLFIIAVNKNHCVLSQSERYIVTSPESHCPTEFMGEPCLTLRQYASLPSQSSNITLILESGNHYLAGSVSHSSSNNITNFAMTAESAKIIDMSQHAYFNIHVSQVVRISGITFIGNFTYVKVSGAQEVIVSECNFQGVSLSLQYVTNASISRCNYYNYIWYYNFYIIPGPAVLNIYESNTVRVVQCNFSNNEGGIRMYGRINFNLIDDNVQSLIIMNSTFINTWGYWGSAVHFYVHSRYYRSYSESQYGFAILDIVDSTFTNNTSKDYGSAVCFTVVDSYNDNSMLTARLKVINSTFTNNTYKEGGAVHFRCYDNAGNATVTLFVHQSIFIGNTAYQKGGAMYLEGCHSNYIISESNFTHNSANSCGALSITKYYDDNIVQISDCIFNYNNATSVSDIGGGALCIMNTTALISNGTFVGNVAGGYGGAVVSHDSIIIINNTLFHNNVAGGDGGALITYAHPSNYTISQSSFTHNQAGDDGGAIFIGHSESYVTLEMCTLTDNNAVDRGGAIAIFGSTMEITETTIDNNTAALGETFSSCNSNVMTSIYGYKDISCSYEGPTINSLNITKSLKGPSFSNITLDVTIGYFCTKHQPEEPTTKEVNKVASAAYASLTISATTILAFLLYLLIEKLVRSKIKCASSSAITPSSIQLQSEPLYAEATAQASDNAEMIEMKPNVLYGKCEPQNQVQPQEITLS